VNDDPRDTARAPERGALFDADAALGARGGAADGDPFDPARVLGAPEPLRAFNEAGVLAAADVHVAERLVALAGADDPAVALAAALAVRAPRLGHVYVDLATIRETAAVEGDEPVDLATLPWPEPDDWLARLAASGLAGEGRPLRLAGSALYLDRYWHEEGRLAEDLRAFSEAPPAEVDEASLAAGLARLFPDGGRQREAAEVALRRRFAVIAGGPGTGKTTTLARIVALLAEQGAPLVALAAPTGKAAARLEEAVHAAAHSLGVPALLALEAGTLHRLLGRRPGSHSRFRHHRGNRLPHDVVIVDETSMVSLSLMARLVEAVRPEARLILVGDPGQLASIEAGAVLGDIVGPASHPAGRPPPSRTAAAGSPRDAIVVLDRVHRFGAGIAALAQAVRAGDGDGVVAVLREAPEGVTWLPVDVAGAPDALAPVRDGAVAAAGAVIAAAEAGEGAAAIAALGEFRVLCGHRRGAHGVATWVARIEGWLAEAVPGFATRGRWYPGRPLLVTENDYGLGLYNGDTGVIVAAPDGRMTAAFERRGEVLRLPPTRLAAIDTVYAMTVHKSQGSQYETAAVLLPEPTSRVLTRELLYTAVTRARRSLILAGTEEAVRAAVARPIARASGLGARLWGTA
jgi:exodeoxyribonuclease V alpha subunit